MAGRGPAPKLPEQRRNGHAPQRGEWVDLPPLEHPILPELPERSDDEDWSSMTRSTWAAWRCDPVTAMWSASDIAYALDAIRLYEQMTPSSANEIRLRMDGLGLTPKGKRDLRWRISGAEEARPARQKVAAATGRRSRLSVVK